MMNRNDEIKNIMRKLRECKKEDVKNESLLHSVNEETETEADLVLGRLEDILARFEKVLSVATGEAEAEETGEEETTDKEDTEEDTAEKGSEEDTTDEEGGEDEEPAEESYERSLEKRLAALERRFTESRRRNLCKRFHR